MDESDVRALLCRLAESAAPRSSVNVERARRAGLRRLRLRRIGAPAASLGAIATVAGLVAGGVVPIASGPAPPTAEATVRLTPAETRVLTDSGDLPRVEAEIGTAFQLVVQRCLHAKGFKYYPSFPPVADFLGGPGLAGVPQAPIGLIARAANGYGFYSPPGNSPGGAGGRSKEESYADSAGKKYVRALDGPAIQRIAITQPAALFGKGGLTILSGGCLGAAERRVYGSVVNYVLATTGASLLTDAMLSAVTADPAFAAVVGRWSSCMADRGYRYSSPEELWNNLAGLIDRQHTPAMRSLEIRTSLADYSCAKTVRLLPTVRALQAWHARNYSAALSGSLARLTSVLSKALKVAQALQVHRNGK